MRSTPLTSPSDLKGNSMTRFAHAIKSLARRYDARDLLEYALLVSLIALVAVDAVGHAGFHTTEIFDRIAGAL